MAKRNLFHLTQLAEQSLDGPARENYDETRALYNVVEASIGSHTYDIPGQLFNPMYFATKAREFVYSLGSEIQQLTPEADAFMLIQGFDERGSGGRKEFFWFPIILPLVLGGPSGPIRVHPLTVALVEAKTGTIVWFYRTLKKYDLRKAGEASEFVEDVLRELPAWGK